MIKTLFFLILSVSIVLAQEDCAFMTLIAGPESEFIDGAIALGRSLMNVREEEYDMVLLHTTQFNLIDAQRLSADGGWKLKYIENAIKQPPGHAYKYRFDQVFNKLAIFNQVEYDTVVYLDADTLVMENIDELCNNLNTDIGAVMRGPSFNSGVLVIRPDEETFKRLVTEIDLVNPRYLNNDQGYLNTVFWDFSACDYVDPLIESREEEETRPLPCARLPARYNGDVLIYAVNNNHWPYTPVTETYEKPKIIHYTFGDIKPWNWYSYLLTPNVWYWWHTYRSSFMSSNVIIYRSLVGTALCVMVNIAFFLISDVASNALMKYLYEQFRASLAGLCCIFFVLQLLAFWIANGIASLYFFTPEINTFLCLIVLWHIMKIILFNFLPQPQKYVSFAYAIIPSLFFVILLFGSGEEITFFARVFIISSLIVVFHWLLFWTVFVRYVAGALYEDLNEAQPKDFKAV